MHLREIFRRTGAASPVVPAGIHVVTSVIADAMLALAPGSVAIMALAFMLWLAGLCFLFIVVTWFRYDDWLEAGFVVGIAILVGGFMARMVGSSIAEGSLSALLSSAPTMFIGVLVRALIMVPLAGGAVTLARILIRPKPKPAPPIDEPERRPKFRFG